MFNLKKLVALIAGLMLYGVEARADSFTIPNVQGSLFVSTSRDGGPPTLRLPPEFNLFGPGLSVNVFIPLAVINEPGNVEARDTCRVVKCMPGIVLGSNSTFSGVLAAHGAMTVVNGVRYDFLRLTGSLNFVSRPIVLPSFASSHMVIIPFTFSGELNGLTVNTLSQIFTATLSGGGFATFRFAVPPDPSNPRYVLDSIEYHFEPNLASIDIKPNSSANVINPRSKGRIPVAILTTASFDATAVDPSTVFFGATGVEAVPVHSALEDVDGDGDVDLVLHFLTQDTGITCDDTSAWLTGGGSFSGFGIVGFDSVETVGCS
jgi:hypothetical protein